MARFRLQANGLACNHATDGCFVYGRGRFAGFKELCRVRRRANRDDRLLNQTYKDRQLIMVGDEDVVQQTRLQLQESEAKTGSILASVGDWAKFASLVVGLAYPPARVTSLAVAAGYEIAKRAVEAWGRANQNTDNRIRLVTLSEAQDIQFPPGHPQVDELYVGHPATAKRYYPAWDFHRAVFEHKFAEAITLLMALGATRIEVHHVAGWSKELVGTMSVDVPVAGGTAEVASNHRKSRDLLLQADLDARRRKPFLPDSLVWYPNEPMWQSIALGRLEHRMRTCQLVVNYEDNYGVSAKLGADIAKLKGKLRLGGEWKNHASTIWRVNANFDAR